MSPMSQILTSLDKSYKTPLPLRDFPQTEQNLGHLGHRGHRLFIIKSLYIYMPIIGENKILEQIEKMSDDEVVEALRCMKSGGSLSSLHKTDYVIAIPSYNRPDIIREKTLTMLKANKIPREKIYVFLHDKEQKELYEKAIPRDMYGTIVITGLHKGIVGQRVFITDYFKENQKIVSIDDDVEKMLIVKNGKLATVYNLNEIIHRGFELCKQYNYTLWGLYPVANAFYMKNTNEYSTDLRFIIGAFYGFINKKRANSD